MLPSRTSSHVFPASTTTVVATRAKERQLWRRRAKPAITVVVVTHNGSTWLNRCLTSLSAQTMAEKIEILVVDNASTDHSNLIAADLLRKRPDWRVIRHQKNMGWCAGNNEVARQARGQYLLFLNVDTWLEPDCLERLWQEVHAAGAVAATPLVMDYGDATFQSAGESGFDIFGLLCGPSDCSRTQDILVANGPAVFIDTKWFRKTGGFDPQFFMYADEYDLCWRVWLTGGRVILAPSARLHHRGGPEVNPNGGAEVIENRTSDSKRYYANRNGLLVLLKNSQHVMLLLVPLQLLMLTAEALVTALWTRRLTYIRRAYVEAVWDCWRMRRHILAERRRVQRIRRRGDFWMLRFLRARLNRWREFRRIQRFGLPKVDSK